MLWSICEVISTIFAWFLSSFGPPSRVLVAYRPERGVMSLHDAVGQTVKRTQFLISRGRCLVYSHNID